MNEHFLTYKQSLAVKELGFDEATICVYNSYGHLKGVIASSVDGDYIKKEKWEDRLPAPLKSQFFKWVRKKYKISGTPQYFTGGYYCYTINDMKDTEKSNRLFTEFETYEQAEDACIDKIIKLIKKQKS